MLARLTVKSGLLHSFYRYLILFFYLHWDIGLAYSVVRLKFLFFVIAISHLYLSYLRT